MSAHQVVYVCLWQYCHTQTHTNRYEHLAQLRSGSCSTCAAWFFWVLLLLQALLQLSACHVSRAAAAAGAQPWPGLQYVWHAAQDACSTHRARLWYLRMAANATRMQRWVGKQHLPHARPRHIQTGQSVHRECCFVECSVSLACYRALALPKALLASFQAQMFFPFASARGTARCFSFCQCARHGKRLTPPWSALFAVVCLYGVTYPIRTELNVLIVSARRWCQAEPN